MWLKDSNNDQFFHFKLQWSFPQFLWPLLLILQNSWYLATNSSATVCWGVASFCADLMEGCCAGNLGFFFSLWWLRNCHSGKCSLYRTGYSYFPFPQIWCFSWNSWLCVCECIARWFQILNSRTIPSHLLLARYSTWYWGIQGDCCLESILSRWGNCKHSTLSVERKKQSHLIGKAFWFVQVCWFELCFLLPFLVRLRLIHKEKLIKEIF